MANQDEFTAIIHFKHDMILYAIKNWPGIADKLNEMFKLNPKLTDDNHVSFEFFLAVLFVQSRAPFSIYGKEQGERIWTYLKNTFAAEPKFGPQANKSLDIYYSAWEYCIEKKEDTHCCIATALLWILGYEEKDNELLDKVLAYSLVTSPPWWKNFAEKNKLVKSDLPLDLDDFLYFVKEVSI